MSGCCEYGNEFAGFLKILKFIDCYFLKTNPAAGSWFRVVADRMRSMSRSVVGGFCLDVEVLLLGLYPQTL